jgi:predicted nucleotidyltransferase
MKHSILMQYFFQHPSSTVGVRELSRALALPVASVQRELQRLTKEQLILRLSSSHYDVYQANISNRNYIFEKKFFIIKQIIVSDLLDILNKKYFPRLVVLYGSCASGEYAQDSDMDIFVECEQAIREVKTIAGHHVHFYQSQELKKVPKHLRESILSGLVLQGIVRL